MKWAYYNEFDEYAAQWLRNLISAGLIAQGEVDQRSIKHVHPDDLRGFTQVHFFAGIGVWSHALRSSGWEDDRPVWTGSCPCQPFSAAGNRAGMDDERHLWPDMFRLIEAHRPAVVMGEQVASKDGLAWLDTVQADLEGAEYTAWAADTCAAGVGAPHIRQRLYWVGYSKRDRLQGRLPGWPNPARGLVYGSTRRDGTVGGLAYATGNGQRQRWQGSGTEVQGHGTERSWQHTKPGHLGELPGRVEGLGTSPDRLAYPNGDGFESRGEASATNGYWSATDADGRAVWVADTGGERRQQDAGGAPGHEEAHGWEPHLDHIFAGDVQVHRSHPTYGFWGNPDWLLCKDGRWRPIEPGVTALVDEPASRVVSSSTSWRTPAGPKGFGHIPSQVKGYGNAICSVQASAFIRAVMEHRP